MLRAVEATNYVQFGIGEKRERVARLAAQVRGNLRRIYADGDWANSERLEFLQLLLDAS